jgi:hypothetical protein
MISPALIPSFLYSCWNLKQLRINLEASELMTYLLPSKNVLVEIILNLLIGNVDA